MSYQPNWFERNWKWAVPSGCFTLLLIGIAFFIGVFALVKVTIRSSAPYKESMCRVKNSPRAIEVLGENFSEEFFGSTAEVQTSNGEGSANLSLELSGNNNTAILIVEAERQAKTWHYQKLGLQGEAFNNNYLDLIHVQCNSQKNSDSNLNE
jgi:hypothetical protein